MYIYKESIHALFVQRAPQTLPRSPPPKVMKRGIERATRLTSIVAAVDVRTFTASQSMATFVDDGAILVPAHAIRKNDIIIDEIILKFTAGRKITTQQLNTLNTKSLSLLCNRAIRSKQPASCLSWNGSSYER